MERFRFTEDITGLTDLRESLPKVVDKVVETKRPTVIAKHNRPVVAIIDIEELQRLYDQQDKTEELEDRIALLEFELAEAGGEMEWYTEDEMEEFVEELKAGARQRA